MTNKNVIIALVAVVIVVAVAIAAYAMHGNGGDSDDDSIGVGDSMTYKVFGIFTETDDEIDGTATWTILGETDDQYNIEMDQSVYAVGTDGKKTAMFVGKESEWTDKASGSDDYVFKGTKVLRTFWGEKELDVYESKDGNTHALGCDDVLYGLMYETDDYTMYMELDGCSAFKDEKINKEPHVATLTMDMRSEIEGVVFTGDYVIRTDNDDTEIFRSAELTMNICMGGIPITAVTQDSWYDPFGGDDGMTFVGTQEIDTEWGKTQTEVYEATEDGQKTTMYLHGGDVPLRMTIDQGGMVFEYNTKALTVDGEDVDLDDFRFN